MTLATLALAASLAFAQTTTTDTATTPGDMPNTAPATTDAPAQNSVDGAAMGTIDNVPPGSTMTNQEGTATPVGYVGSTRDNGIAPTLMWLVPLLIALAVMFPLARRWSQRRDTDVTVRPRV